MNKTVYLAGPICGLNYSGATDWRDSAIKSLSQSNIVGLSPMRAKEYLKGVESFKAAGYNAKMPMSTDKGITTRDRFDCMNADVILFNFVGSDKISIGSIIELGWADAFRKPVVICMDYEGIYKHGMVLSIAGFVVSTLDEGIDICKAILGTY